MSETKSLCAVGGREILRVSQGIKGKVMEETVFNRKETHMNEGPVSTMPCPFQNKVVFISGRISRVEV